ncbi:hypothetical protein EOS_35805 [Caballeronia mineralivorans PML1(12)]|uniref:Pathogenicity island effector protein n=1 Tax=Caballeronia mineralivorans PML1(12) TaxID=908627 RepID=A0A0J1CL90_9BURK|nr:hypothetical protein [Caballeronia mineralivorans]KLU21530.1 hypothetical protein EOS_35805 [Caballeronia mineralivorans PML1(12)]
MSQNINSVTPASTPPGRADSSGAVASDDQPFSISTLMIEVTKLFQELRDQGQEFYVQSLQRQFSIQMEELKLKQDSIDDTKTSALLGGSFEIAAGGLGVMAGAGSGAAGLALKNGMGVEAGMQAGNVLGRMTDGTGKVAAAYSAADAQTSTVLGEFAGKNAEQYKQGMDQAMARIQDLREKALQACAAYKDLYDRNASAIKMA